MTKIPKFLDKESIEERIRTLHSVWNTVDILRSILSSNTLTGTSIYEYIIELANTKTMFELVLDKNYIKTLRTYYPEYEQHFKDCMTALTELMSEMDAFLNTFRTDDNLYIKNKPLDRTDIDKLTAILNKYL